MRGLVLEGTRHIAYRDDLVEPEVLDPRDAIVELTAAGLCGSDLHPYEGREAVQFGVVQGHEIVGHVVAVGSQVTTVRPGDRVLAVFTTSCGRCGACRRGLSARCESGWLFGYGAPGGDVLHGGQAERVRVPLADGTLVKVPPSLSDKEAVLLTDNLPTAAYAVQRADVGQGDAVAIVGLGSVGLLSVVASRAAGAGTILGIDPVDDRRQRAAALGATVRTHDNAADLRGHFDAVIEAAGTMAAQRLAFSLVRPGGTLSIIAVQTDQAFAFSPVQAYDSNITVRTGRAPVRSLLDKLLTRVTAGELPIPAAAVVTHDDVPLADGPDLYRRFAAREPGLVKAVFAPMG